MGHLELCLRTRTRNAHTVHAHACVDVQSADGAEIQALLLELTKQRTVPNVFIKGQHIGGADATLALHADKKLVPLLQ